MSFINTQEKEINCKIAYIGPPHAGKATSLHDIYAQTSAHHRGKLVSLSDEENKTLFFDFLPLSLGKVKDYTIRFHLYTVPGQVPYNSSRKVILNGIDGVIFVVDSQIDRLEENLESWKSLQSDLRDHNLDFQTIPLVLQYNKRDLGDIMPVAELNTLFNERQLPEFETVATTGKHVMECFQAVAKMILKELK